MSGRWLISVPVWGERCVNVFCATALPALEQAIIELTKRQQVDVKLVCHTDSGKRIRSSATQIAVDDRPVPAGARDFDCLSQAHRDVLSMACRDDVVVLLTADLIVPRRALCHCYGAMTSPGKKLLMCASIRTVEQGRIPIEKNADELLRWAWENRHAMTKESTWPDGRIADLSRVFLQHAGGVATHQCLPHPLAVRIDGRPLPFTPTIDATLMQNFEPGEIHYEKNMANIGLIELSPVDKPFQLADEDMQTRLKKESFKLSNKMQRHLVGHCVTVFGKASPGDTDEMIKMMLKT